VPLKKPKISLFCFIDALGWEIVQKYGFLNEVLTHQQPLDTVFGYSSTCDPTIITGAKPSDHGHFSFYYYNPKESPFTWMSWLGLLPKSITSRGRVRHWISRLLKKVLGYTGYFQIYTMPFSLMRYFDYSEKRDIYQPGGINGGQETIFAQLEREKIPYFLSPWWTSEQHNLQLLKDTLVQQSPQLAYLYMASMDAILHADGTDSPRVREKIRWYEQQLLQVLEVAHSQYEEVRLYVFSDHGMTDVTSLSSLRGQIERLPLTFGKDYVAVFDSTMARFWFLNDQARQQITAHLSACPDGKIMTDAELDAYGCLFPGYKYGELFYLLKPGVLLCPSHLGETALKGMHGYAPEDRDSVASLLSNCEPPIPMKGLADLFKLMQQEVH
jgi:hypothetical protein